jgi:hypothetical protein
MTELEALALEAALAAVAKIAPELSTAVGNLVHAFVAKAPLTPALKHLEAVADAKALGLNPAKV